MNSIKRGRPQGSKNTPLRTLDLRTNIPPPEPKIKLTFSEKNLLKNYNPDGLPDFRTKLWKDLSYNDKLDYIAEQIAIAIENKNKKNLYEKDENIDKYDKLDVSKFPFNFTIKEQTEAYLELLPVFYNIYIKYKGQQIIFRYIKDDKIFYTKYIDIPKNNFSKWWKNYSKFGYDIFDSSSETRNYSKKTFEYIDSPKNKNDEIPDLRGHIFIYTLKKKERLSNMHLQSRYIRLEKYNKNEYNEQNNFLELYKKQFFKEHMISNCLLQPIKDWAIKSYEEAESKSAKYRYKKLIEKTNDYIEKYILSGVPEDEINNICNDLQIDISISLPLNKEIKLLEEKSNKKALKKFNFINTKFNHIELDKILYQNNNIEYYYGIEGKIFIDEDYLNNLKNTLDLNNKFYIYKMNENKITSIITQNGNYKIRNKFQEITMIFEDKTGLKNCKICDIEDYELSKFVRDSCHYNCSLNFVDNINDNYNINHIDMSKAYANFKHCNYYNGFLGKITDFRQTNKIMGIGLYQIDNIDFSNCDIKIKELLLKLNIYHNKYIYTSPELKFLEDYKIKFNIICGAWGHSPLDFEFDDSMINEKDNGVPYYAKWCGFINSQFLQTNYILKSSFDYHNILKYYGDNYDNITYLENLNETIITINKKNNYHLSHINSFITSYQRLNLIEQLFEFDINSIIKINVDCIYYNGNKEINLKNVFRHKEFKNFKLNNCDNSLIPLFEEIENYKYSNINIDYNYKSKINLGCGGSGKTTKELRDDGLIKKIFCPPSWKLARNKEKEENVNCSVWHYLLTSDITLRNNILKKYNVLIIDEVSMMTEKQKEFILNEFKLCKIIFCGDLGFQLPPIKDKEMTIENIENVEYFNNNYRCKCPKLLELLNNCREFIKSKKSLDFINNWIIKYFKKNNRIINLEKLKELYDINDMILAGTNEIKDEYTNLFKDKFEMKKLYITSNSRQYSNGEILITNNKIVGVSSEERYCYTTHSIQGETAYDKLFIDISRMFDERMFYTALSRAMYFEQIYLVSYKK